MQHEELPTLLVQEIHAIRRLEQIAIDANTNGCRMVSRLIQEWNDGSNRFDQAGEKIYGAVYGSRICGVCGLNRDPFAGDLSVGRVRRLYVHSNFRRCGIGSALMRRLIADARLNFRTLHLRTFDPVATAFYSSLGFSHVTGNSECTQLLLLADNPSV